MASQRSLSRRATHLGLLLGGIFLPLAVPAVAMGADSSHLTSAAQPALMLARDWRSDLDPAGFLVSEKLDGVRAFWDGQTLRFLSGRRIAAPEWFTAALPATPLDGELWLARRSFDRLSAIVRRSAPVDAEWRDLRYMIFDLPGAQGTFNERAERIVSLVGDAALPWLQAVEQRRVPDRIALQSQLVQGDSAGAEGLVLHRADALWQPGRSDALFKLKTMPDEDAQVLAHLPGKGRHEGRMGALWLQMSNGQRFALGTGFSDAQRAAPPPLGSFVTYRYRDRTPSGLPRFASFVRVREVE